MRRFRREIAVFCKKYWGVIKKVVTVVTAPKSRHKSCVTTCPQKVVTALVTVVTKWLQTGYKVVTAYLAMRFYSLYVNWLQSGYALARRETGGCNHFSTRIYTP